ncbi:MAG: thioredoxin-dependent thiol peroxidase [Flavobacteriales bacterium]|nr:thioredoxin-dependent thiol peroxidase [Flavobacteriales bacterium]MCB9194535.1 thioredoxin-dependent thiol peroxidase [Flavobacteriales bacterium]
MAGPKVGGKAPELHGVDQDGVPVSLKDYAGRKLVLFFYPQDNTPTCTEEACAIRDGYARLRKAGYAVLGVSPDSPRKHTNFIRRFKLPFRLLADQDLRTIGSYGVWGPKKAFGREYMGVLRTTFLIDERGRIARIINEVTAKAHTDQVLEEHV